MTEEKQSITPRRECLRSIHEEKQRWFFLLPRDSKSGFLLLINGNPVDTFKFHYFKPARPEEHPEILGLLNISSELTNQLITITKDHYSPVVSPKNIYSFEYPKQSRKPVPEVNYTYSVNILLTTHSETWQGEAVAFYFDIETKVINSGV